MWTAAATFWLSIREFPDQGGNRENLAMFRDWSSSDVVSMVDIVFSRERERESFLMFRIALVALPCNI
jgi:hypothetical protein